MSVGEIVSEAWALYRAQWRHLIPLAGIFYVILSLLTLVLAALLSWLGIVVGAFVSIVGFFWLQGALVEAIADVRDGRADLSISETFQRVRPRVPALIAAGLLAGLAIAVGLLLLIVPGVILLTWWCLISSVIVIEGARAGESFGRSRELVRGHGWTVFGVILVTILIVAIVGGILSAILTSVMPNWLGGYISNVVVDSITAPFFALSITLMYFRLRGPAASPGELSPTAA
jgi:hypothetical protein